MVSFNLCISWKSKCSYFGPQDAVSKKFNLLSKLTSALHLFSPQPYICFHLSLTLKPINLSRRHVRVITNHGLCSNLLIKTTPSLSLSLNYFLHHFVLNNSYFPRIDLKMFFIIAIMMALKINCHDKQIIIHRNEYFCPLIVGCQISSNSRTHIYLKCFGKSIKCRFPCYLFICNIFVKLIEDTL